MDYPNQYNYPIPNEGLNYVPPTHCDPNPVSIYPSKGDIDWTVINPQPKNKSFFEFAQTFWKNTINVRNRQFATDGGTSGYPTLQSIYWRYLESENIELDESEDESEEDDVDEESTIHEY